MGRPRATATTNMKAGDWYTFPLPGCQCFALRQRAMLTWTSSASFGSPSATRKAAAGFPPMEAGQHSRTTAEPRTAVTVFRSDGEGWGWSTCLGEGSSCPAIEDKRKESPTPSAGLSEKPSCASRVCTSSAANVREPQAQATSSSFVTENKVRSAAIADLRISRRS
jgi:hypothetical protein